MMNLVVAKVSIREDLWNVHFNGAESREQEAEAFMASPPQPWYADALQNKRYNNPIRR